MATVNFIIKGNSNPTTVLVRFINGRKHDFKRSTSIQVNPKNWNQQKGEYRKMSTSEDRDKKNGQLQNLRSFLLETYNIDYAKGTIISSNWLKESINKFFNRNEETDLDLFVHYGRYFIENLPNRVNQSKGTKLGVEPSTVKKYKTVINKIEGFEKYRKSKLYIHEVNPKFQKDFIHYLRNTEKLSENYTGRLIKFVKTICLDAKAYGIKTHSELNRIKGFSIKAKFICLNEEEIERIATFDFSKSPYLDNARDWLIVGVYTGQRVSDFLNFSKTKINNSFIELTQKKTNEITMIPLNVRVKEILNKYNGNFPRRISDQKFNVYIKIVCKKVEMTEIVEGSKKLEISKGIWRNVKGNYPKHELVSSHICRRTFATIHYGKLPTPVLMSITKHSTEKMFLTYIGKTSKDHAEILKQYWEQIQNPKKLEISHLKIVTS